jgi:hypothetical protein
MRISRDPNSQNRIDPIALLSAVAALPNEGHDAEWLEFIGDTLRLPPCYLPAAQQVLRQNRWRRLTGKGQNPIGYVKTATHQQALRMGLALDRYNQTEPRVVTKDAPADKPRDVPDDLRFDAHDKRVGHVPLAASPDEHIEDCIDRHFQAGDGMLVKTAAGTWHQGGTPDDYEEPVEIPEWLQSPEDPDAVNWHAVAQQVVRKPRMAAAVAKVLELRASGTSRPRAIAAASSEKEKSEIGAAWKWVDREWGQIVRLFRSDSAPVSLDQSKRKDAFISAPEALSRKARSAVSLLSAGPSLLSARVRKRQPAASRRFTYIDPIGLRDSVFSLWDGSTLALIGFDGTFLIRSNTLDAAIEAVQNARQSNEKSEELEALLLGPAGRQYSFRPKVYLTKDNELSGLWENVPKTEL